MFRSTLLLSIIFGFMQQSTSYATTVAVYAESGLITSENKLLVKVYADITDSTNGGPLVSAGFKLSYDGPLQNPVATKNENTWYFGTPGDKLSYIDPDIDTPGEVIFLLGKLDQNSPLAGVSGNKILLGSVLFDYSGSAPTAADLALTDGHDGNFVDFATTGGNNLDSSIQYSISPVVSNQTLLLIDAVRTLQVSSGVTPDVTVRTDGDVDGDGRMGLAETIDLLHQAAE